MDIELAYGDKKLNIDIDDNNLLDVATLEDVKPVQDPEKKVAESLYDPIGSKPIDAIISPGKKICIVISDITRAVPTKLILKVLLAELARLNIDKDDITILIATGLHRPNLGEELIALVGKEVSEQYRIINHYARRLDTCRAIGKTKSGTPVILDRTYLDADIKILTGLIEPHFMAGFSGGRKAICPGISYMDMFKHFHGPDILESPYASVGVLKNNPFHMESTEIAKMAGVDFIINVTIDKEKRITGIFAGDLEEAFVKGAGFCLSNSSYNISGEADIVVTTGGGLPLDATLYQAVKGMVGALPAVKKDGMIIIASECREEIGSDEFIELVTEEKDLDLFMEKIKDKSYFKIDQWELEEFVKARKKADIYLYSSCMLNSTFDIPSSSLIVIDSIDKGLEIGFERFGKNAKVTVIPEGPYCIPILKK